MLSQLRSLPQKSVHLSIAFNAIQPYRASVSPMTASTSVEMPLEHCTQGTLPSVVTGESLATYRWSSIPNGVTPRAVVLLLHGFRSHTCYTFLRNEDGQNVYGTTEASSFARELNARGCIAAAHDHIGHGRSSGLRAYFASFDSLVSDALSHARKLRSDYAGLPLFICGHSLGGTVAIVAAIKHADLFTGMCLSSAACEPPADMFGVKGTILASISSILSFMVPKMEVLALPKNLRDPAAQQMFENDKLNIPDVQLRARVGREFILVYAQIERMRDRLDVPFMAAAGELDTLVNPQAAERFKEGAGGNDKTLFVAKERWHNLFTEGNKEEIWALFGDWILERAQ